MLPVLIDILLLVLRSFVAVNLNRLKIKRVTLLRFNRIEATETELKEAIAINKKVGDRLDGHDTLSNNKALVGGVNTSKSSEIQEIERALIATQEEMLQDVANARGIGFISNSEPYSEGDELKPKLLEMAREEGENFVIGTLANKALVVTAGAAGGAVTAIGVGVDMTITAARSELSKIKEEEQRQKEEYVRENERDVLMLSESAKKRIHFEAVAQVRARDQAESSKLATYEMVAGSPAWVNTKKKLDAKIRSLKWLLRFLDFAFALLTTVLIMIGLVMVITALVIFAVISFVVTGMDVDKETSTGKDTTVQSKPEKDTSNSVSGTTSLPKGIDEKSWSKADEWGQKIASQAIQSATMTVDTPRTSSNGGHLVYQQGNTPVGVYDCSTFVSGVFESFGVLTTGGKREGNYDFKTGRKSDLKAYMATAGMRAFYAGKSDMQVGTLWSGDWESKLWPGDLLLMSGHVAIYVGKNSNGEHIMAHAASPSAFTFYDTSLTKKGRQVGLAPISNLKSRSGPISIIRPTVAFK